MNKVYDNGGVLIGNIDLVIEIVKKTIEKDIDMVFIDRDELLKDLLELKNNTKAEIVYINYDCGINYSMNYWCKEDEIKEI